MGSLEKRLKALEAQRPERGYSLSPELRAMLREVENYQRQEEGLPPLDPTAEELTLDRESDMRFLREDIPVLRADPGWQGEEAQRKLDEWEHDIRSRWEANRTEGD